MARYTHRHFMPEFLIKNTLYYRTYKKKNSWQKLSFTPIYSRKFASFYSLKQNKFSTVTLHEYTDHLYIFYFIEYFETQKCNFPNFFKTKAHWCLGPMSIYSGPNIVFIFMRG
jgi:hypothetical protein